MSSNLQVGGESLQAPILSGQTRLRWREHRLGFNQARRTRIHAVGKQRRHPHEVGAHRAGCVPSCWTHGQTRARVGLCRGVVPYPPGLYVRSLVNIKKEAKSRTRLTQAWMRSRTTGTKLGQGAVRDHGPFGLPIGYGRHSAAAAAAALQRECRQDRKWAAAKDDESAADRDFRQSAAKPRTGSNEIPLGRRPT